MAQVNVTISGKTYRMACDDGQEEHLGRLAERIDQLVERLRGEFGEIGDQRLTVMAAITLADQNAEAEGRLAQLEAKIAEMEQMLAAHGEYQQSHEAAIARSIDTVAERMEALAVRIADQGHPENGI
jgi:cell division protein ZapA